MLKLKTTGQFKKDLKRVAKQGKHIDSLQDVVDLLQTQKSLDQSFPDHALVGDWKGHRECHLKPDWLLIYRIQNDQLILVRSGSHGSYSRNNP